MTPFRTTRKLHFGDCDPSAIAYFPSYFNLLVGVVEDFFEAIGTPWPTLFASRRIGVPSVRLDATFTAPGLHGHVLDWEVRVAKVGRSSLTLHHVVSHAGTSLWTATQVLVATSLDTNTSIAWPDDIRAALLRHVETSHAPHPPA